jgi:zinc/manganese transport system substrate-binding protein
MKSSPGDSFGIHWDNWLLWLAGTCTVLIILGSALALFPDKPGTASSQTIKLVAAENFWGDIAATIGGSHVSVTSIIANSNADPHQYESDARDGLAVAEAAIVITNGLGYDDSIARLLSSSPNSSRSQLIVADILGAHGGANPHLWYDTPQIPKVAAAIERELAVRDPGDIKDFERNLTRFDNSLQPILITLARIRQRYSGVSVAYTERVPGYMLANAGLVVVTPPGFAQAVENGNDPNPADTAAMSKLIATRAVRAVIDNAQTTSATTEQVRASAVRAGVPVVEVTETMPADARDYQSWQLSDARALLKALGQ